MQVVYAFFDAYRAHDVETMVDLCDDMAAFRYVPLESWTKQRVVRGDGKVKTIGKVIWTGMIEAFPDLTNEVTRVLSDDSGTVAAEVILSGTQERDWWSIKSRRCRFNLPQLFLFHLNDEDKIDGITSYWDNASFYAQLGQLEID